MTKPGKLDDLPPKGDACEKRASSIDAGHIRVCDELLVSINRSWQTGGPSDKPPVAAFKATAPVAFWSRGGPEAGDIYLAAIAIHDAWWLGFETESAPFAVQLQIDGRNAVTKDGASDASLSADPANFLLVPDQPWFDSIRDAGGLHHQLVPSFGPPHEPGVGARIRLTAFKMADELLTPHPDRDLDMVQPLFSVGKPGAAGQTHVWQGRSLVQDARPPEPCGRITLLLVTPEDFQALTGTELDSADFIDSGDAPEPFDPFQ